MGAAFAALATDSPERTVEGLLAGLTGFCAGRALDDDVSMVVVRRI